jgi:hypothetical protein
MSARRPLGAPIGREFLAVCERIDPESESLYRKVVHESVAAILGDEASAEVFPALAVSIDLVRRRRALHDEIETVAVMVLAYASGVAAACRCIADLRGHPPRGIPAVGVGSTGA